MYNNLMPFITQGKTNIKYILIVVILAAIAGGGILAYSYWWVPKHETAVPEVKLPEKKPLTELEMDEWINHCENFSYPELDITPPIREQRDLCYAYFLSFNKATDFKVLCPKINQSILHEYCLLKDSGGKNLDITFNIYLGAGAVGFGADDGSFSTHANDFSFLWSDRQLVGSEGVFQFVCDFCKYFFCKDAIYTIPPGSPEIPPNPWENAKQSLCK